MPPRGRDQEGADGASGELVKVAWARDRVEAEMLQGLLESEGIPSVLQPVGIDGPQIGVGWLNPSGGARRVMVRAGQAEQALALLAGTLAEPEEFPEPANARYLEADRGGRAPRSYGLIGGYARIYFWSFAAMGLAFLVFLLVRAL